jgi:hypothetical protein
MPSAEIMAALDKLEKAAAAEKAAADAKTAAAAEAAAAAEKEAKVAVDQTITASQTAVDSTIPAETPSAGGRKTKKRGLKKMRKTRRPARLFKY